MSNSTAQRILMALAPGALRDRRVDLNLTQREVGEYCGGTSINTVGHWERGSMPRGDRAAKLVELLGLDELV